MAMDEIIYTRVMVMDEIIYTRVMVMDEIIYTRQPQECVSTLLACHQNGKI